MPKILFQWVVTSLTILMIPYLVHGIYVKDFGTALAVAAVLGVLNVIIKPILILLTLPLTLVSLGFFLLVVNGIVFKLAAWFVSGFVIDSFSSAFFAAIIVSLVSWIMNLSFRRKNGKRTFQVRRDENVIEMHNKNDRWE